MTTEVDPGSPFAATVDKIGSREGLDIRVLTQRTDRGGATAWGGRRPRVTVGPSLLDQSAALQQWAAAHEVAHIVSGHSLLRVLLPAAGLAGLYAGGWIAALILLPDSALLAIAPVIDLVVIGTGVALLVGVVALVVTPLRRNEAAADRLACRWGFHMPPEAVTWLEDHESRLVHSRPFKPLRFHADAHTRNTDCRPDRQSRSQAVTIPRSRPAAPVACPNEEEGVQ